MKTLLILVLTSTFALAQSQRVVESGVYIDHPEKVPRTYEIEQILKIAREGGLDGEVVKVRFSYRAKKISEIAKGGVKLSALLGGAQGYILNVFVMHPDAGGGEWLDSLPVINGREDKAGNSKPEYVYAVVSYDEEDKGSVYAYLIGTDYKAQADGKLDYFWPKEKEK